MPEYSISFDKESNVEGMKLVENDFSHAAC